MKKLPDSLRALGRHDPPDSVNINGAVYKRVRVFKHDFFAATALYDGPSGKIIVKLGRRAEFLGVPTRWIGRLLAAHESTILEELQDLDCIPESLGRYGDTGVAHSFVEGAHLTRGANVPDEFFPALRAAVQEIHKRNMAVVDLEKPQNVLLGDDGRPYLIDFQISWRLPRHYGGEWIPLRWLRRRFQEGDIYHLLKLQRRFRRDQLTEDQIRESYRKPPWVRWHGWITKPLQKVRRHMLNRLDPERKTSERGTVGN